MRPALFLQSLTLKNFATFENQTIQFQDIFNGIVGETGSGKSLILDAFELVLGSRAEKKMIRKGKDSAIIEGVFSLTCPRIESYFYELGHPVDDEQVVIKRIIEKDGKSKCYLNHLQCSLSVLRKFSKRFVDLVGQFENQKLMSQDYQLVLLDLYGKSEPLLKQYQEIYREFTKNFEKYQGLLAQQESAQERKDYLNFQLSELSSIELSQEEESQLIHQKASILNQEKFEKTKGELGHILGQSDFSVLGQLTEAQNICQEISEFLNEEELENFKNAISIIEDFSYSIEKLDFSRELERPLEDVLKDLDVYQKLKRKYRLETHQLEQKKQVFEKELESLENIEQEVQKTQQICNDLENECFELAKKLSKSRQLNSTKLSKEMTKAIRTLNMKGATFKVEVIPTETLRSRGMDTIEFKAELNPGEGLHVIRDVASGGELSRILLSLRRVISSHDTISIFFFDEIDTGIGGETAKLIGKTLKEVSEKSQVITITHLPQIAQYLDKVVLVEKKSKTFENEKRTISVVKEVGPEDKKQLLNSLAGLD